MTGVVADWTAEGVIRELFLIRGRNLEFGDEEREADVMSSVVVIADPFQIRELGFDEVQER